MTPNENHSLSDQIAERTCKFCSAAFTTAGMTVRHETQCAKRTPEQRHHAAWARDHYRKNYSVAAQKPKPKLDKPVVAAEEQALLRKRERQRKFYAKYGRDGKHGQAKQLEREVKKASILLTGQRVQITLSLDWETARQLIVQLIPDISIDGVTLK